MNTAVGTTYNEWMLCQATQDVRRTGHISLYFHHQMTMAGMDSDVIEKRIQKQLKTEEECN